MAGKAGSLGEEARTGEEQSQGGIASLEEFDDRFNRVQIGRLDREHLSGFTGQFLFAFAHLLKHRLEPRSTEGPEHHFNAEVCLGGLNPATTEKPREIGSGRVGSIQLSEGGDEEQDRGSRHALTYHTSLNECQVPGL